MSSKVNEANDFMLQAEKSLKTSFFKRTPDFDSAIDFYKKAALIFRNCKLFEQAADAYEKAASLNFKVGSYFHCAKNYENASLMYRDLKKFDRVVNLIETAGQLLRENGTPDSASYVYERAAKFLEEPLPENAGEFYEKSAEACEVEDKFHQAADQANNASRVWVRIRRFADAERSLRKFIEYTTRANSGTVAAAIGGFTDASSVPNVCSRAVIVLILIKLYQEDEVAAKKIYSEAVQQWGFGLSDVHPSVTALLSAVEQCDANAAATVIKSSCFRTLDLDYARLAREIKFPSAEATEEQYTTSNTTQMTPSHSSERAPVDSTVRDGNHSGGDDEEEEDIC